MCWLWLSRSEVAPVSDLASATKNEPFELLPRLFLTKLRLLLPSLLLSLLQDVFFLFPNKLFLFCRPSLTISFYIWSVLDVFYLLTLPIDLCWELFSAASFSLMFRFAEAFWRRSLALSDWLTEVRDNWMLERYSLPAIAWECWAGVAIFWPVCLSKDINGFMHWFLANTELVLLWVSGFSSPSFFDWPLFNHWSDLVCCEPYKSIVFPIALLAIGERDASTFSAWSSVAFLGLSYFSLLLPLLSLLKSSSSGESRAAASRNMNLLDIG